MSCTVLDAVRALGISAFGLKPVAAGGEVVDGKLCNEDALALMRHSFPVPAYDEVNPCLLASPIAPHIAAREEGRTLAVEPLLRHCRDQLAARDGFALVEGAGGWRVPLNERECLSDLAIALRLPVLLVVPIQLGCLNHTLLTAEAIRRDGLTIAGWVANKVSPVYSPSEQNILTLEDRLGLPCLARFPLLSASYTDLKEGDFNPLLPFLDVRPLLENSRIA
ncbi:Copyrinic acid a,c-diamide synthase:dethiobiotin synthetase [gamma proteobacterium HdN1]|nr:Copyrinic acid a,c-diamide synthase:dethiobiotin synthetase [gamma proteobacterium HdN1]